MTNKRGVLNIRPGVSLLNILVFVGCQMANSRPVSQEPVVSSFDNNFDKHAMGEKLTEIGHLPRDLALNTVTIEKLPDFKAMRATDRRACR